MTDQPLKRRTLTFRQPEPVIGRDRLVARQSNKAGTRVQVGPVTIGGDNFVIAAGPCAVEPGLDLNSLAIDLAHASAALLRGGIFKPRTDPDEFQGIGPVGFDLLAEAREKSGLPVVSELMTPSQVEQFASRIDIIQIGSRHMANTPLLKTAGASDRPVLLKRGMSATVREWLLAAEYLMGSGNERVILCERGIRTFETATRNTLDLSAVALARRETHLPVIVDPSHAAGRPDIIQELCQAAVAVGADGLLLEVHPQPEGALSDGSQALTPLEFRRISESLMPYLRAAGRQLETIQHVTSSSAHHTPTIV